MWSGSAVRSASSANPCLNLSPPDSPIGLERSLIRSFISQEARMAIQLKPIEEQVIVIAGASSGIGLVTAKHAARAGARVVLAARNESSLRSAVAGIRR